MLRPSKHAHPDQTVVAAATIILRALKKKRIVQYDDLVGVLGDGSAMFLFLPAISLLHLLGVVEYRETVDSFEYVGA